MCSFCGDMFHVIDRSITRESIERAIISNEFVSNTLRMILDREYREFVENGGIDDEFIDTLFTTHVLDIAREFIENEYEIDIFDLYEIDVESAAQMIEEMFVYYAHHMNREVIVHYA